MFTTSIFSELKTNGLSSEPFPDTGIDGMPLLKLRRSVMARSIAAITLELGAESAVEGNTFSA